MRQSGLRAALREETHEVAAERTTPLSLAFQILGATAGLGALVTLVGGAMLWVRFEALALPADRAVAMLPKELLVVVGGHSLLGPLIAAAVVAGGVLVLQPLDRDGHLKARFWFVGLPILVLLAVVALVTQAFDMDSSYALVAIFAAILAVGAIVGTAWRGTRARFIAWTVLAACAGFGAALAVLRTLDEPRMEPVGVLTKTDPQGIAGFYVGESDDRLYVVPVPGNDDPTHPLADAKADSMLVIPRDDVTRIAMREPIGIETRHGGRDRAQTLLLDMRSSAEQAAGDELVRSLSPERDFAPLVHLHADEDWYPMSARGFVANSVLNWSNRPKCPPEVIATGKAVPGDKPFGELDAAALGAGTELRRSPDAPNCDPDTDNPSSFLADQLTRPYVEAGRPARLPLEQGFYLDIANDVRDGHRDVHKEGPQEVLQDVPVYVQRDEEKIGRRKDGIRLTYWFLYGFSEPPGPRGLTRLISHEGDWERVSVLLRRGREPDTYLPLSVRFFHHNESRDLPWSAVRRASGTGKLPTDLTHPVVYSARGSHASFWRAGEYESVFERRGRRHVAVDDTAIACPDCPVWRTWELMKDVRKEPWYGFGGAWGKVGGSGDTTGPLGPSKFKP